MCRSECKAAVVVIVVVGYGVESLVKATLRKIMSEREKERESGRVGIQTRQDLPRGVTRPLPQ